MNLMLTEELKHDVWELIEDCAKHFSKREYIDFLIRLRDDADIRAEAVRDGLTDHKEKFYEHVSGSNGRDDV